MAQPLSTVDDSFVGPSEVRSEPHFDAMIEIMYRLGSQGLAHGRRSAVIIFCATLVLVPSVCAATVFAPGHHDGDAGHHLGDMDVAAHAHWSSPEHAGEHHGSHACCAIAAHKPAREKGLAAHGSIDVPALGARTIGGSMAGSFCGRPEVEAPPGTPGLTVTSAPLRC